MTREEIQSAIAKIKEALKGPMPNLERALLVADRKDAWVDLAALDQVLKSGSSPPISGDLTSDV